MPQVIYWHARGSLNSSLITKTTKNTENHSPFLGTCIFRYTLVCAYVMSRMSIMLSCLFIMSDIHTHSACMHARTHAHTTIYGPLGFCLGLRGWAGTGKVKPGRYNQSRLVLPWARDSELQWHQLGHMQTCTLTQTHNHANISPLSLLKARCPSCRPTNSIKTLKAIHVWHSL